MRLLRMVRYLCIMGLIVCATIESYVTLRKRTMYGVVPMDPIALIVGLLTVQNGPEIIINEMLAVLSCRPHGKVVLVGDR